jgi:hypothetical protein
VAPGVNIGQGTVTVRQRRTGQYVSSLALNQKGPLLKDLATHLKPPNAQRSCPIPDTQDRPGNEMSQHVSCKSIVGIPLRWIAFRVAENSLNRHRGRRNNAFSEV